MVLVNYIYNGNKDWGVVDRISQRVFAKKIAFKEQVPDTIEEFIKMSNRPELANVAELDKEALSLSEIRYLPPVEVASKNIICIGKNYLDHIKELSTFLEPSSDVIDYPVFFTKSLNTLNAPYDTVSLHSDVTSEVDYEGELAIIIGKSGRNISKKEVSDYILGFTIINDVTARDLQRNHKQWFKGKSLDGFCPCGPWIVTKDEIEDPHNLSIKTYVNGEIRQESSTSQMIFRIEDLVSSISQGLTLNAGDIISTGTPSGVGSGMNPPRFLKNGDVVRVEIGGIGFIENTFI